MGEKGDRVKPAVGTEASISIRAGGIAHDLNTIITTIYGYCEMALEDIEDGTRSEKNIKAILSAADRARLLTGQLLDLSRNASFEKVPVRVADVLADTIAFIKPSLSDEIRIILDIKTPDAWVMTQPVQLFRIFLNLSVNAIQAMQENGGILTITCETAEVPEKEKAAAGATSILIMFSDTGTGMDEQISGEIFRPFFTSGRQNGTGLGLAIVADAVSELGGTIDVATSPGSGTTFRLIIPVAFFGPLPEKD